MIKFIGYLLTPLLTAALFASDGIASLAVFAVVVIHLLAVMMVSTALGNEEVKAAMMKDTSTTRRVISRVSTAVFILAAAHQGFVISAAILLITWVYTMIVHAVLRAEDNASTVA